MMNLLNIELKKITTYRVFWVMVILYVLAVVFIFFGFPSLVDYFAVQYDSKEVKLLKNFIYNYPDIWQNLSWVASLRFFIKIFMGLIIIILVTNEYSYNTVRLNIMNGLSRLDFLKSKIYLIVLFAFAATLLVLFSGLILGLIYSSTTAMDMILKKSGYLLGYFVEVLSYMSFAMMLALLLKRTGLAISVLFIYPIIELIVQQNLNEAVHPYLPMSALNHIIRTPNTSLIQYSSPSNDISLQIKLDPMDFVISLAYAAIFIGVSYWVLKRKDL